jgi:hypothetical protein
MTVRTFFHSGSDGSLTVRRVQDVEPIIENNKALQNEPQNKSEVFRRVGSIPCVIIEKWMNEDGVPFFQLPAYELGRYISRKLRDPDYRWLRTVDKP